MSNEDFGEELKAVVQPVDACDIAPALAEELIDYCRQHLAAFKCPRTIDFEEQLPRHATGKLYKKLVRYSYWPQHPDAALISIDGQTISFSIRLPVCFSHEARSWLGTRIKSTNRFTLRWTCAEETLYRSL